MSNTKETTAWAVVDPKGEMFPCSVGGSENEATIRYQKFSDPTIYPSWSNWLRMQKDGYSCIEVVITPKKAI
jgi:hypothetical protein